MPYFDHNAGTPTDPRVLAAMEPWWSRPGNASAAHSFGQAAREAVEAARAEVAELLGAEPPEIVFTASGTEANNTAVASCLRPARGRGRAVISALEHASVAAAAGLWAGPEGEVVEVAPEPSGRIAAEAMVEALAPAGARRADLVALTLASNELGTLQPVAEVAPACREAGVPMLCDAAQGIGRVEVRPRELGVDLLSLGGHKLGAPPGTGALWVRRGHDLAPLVVGGGQERRRRAASVNVPGVVGLGAACRLAVEELAGRRRRLAALRDRFEARLAAALPAAVVHGAGVPRLPNTSHVAFPGIDAEALVIRLDLAGWAVSTGSACASGALGPSRAAAALGLGGEEARGSLRVSFGVGDREEEVDGLVAALEREVAALAGGSRAVAGGAR